MKKILLLGLWNNTNLGDVVIAECTEYLVKKITNRLGILCDINHLDIMEEKYESIINYDLLIFTGGGIVKYKYQEFYKYIDRITELAEEYNIPVIFNGVGIEDYDETNNQCQLLKRALNRHCVKGISTRDDIGLLKQEYITQPDITIAKVADPAVWTKEVYGITKKKSTVIGLGMIREGIFRSNGINIGREELFKLWSQIVNEIENHGDEWRIFTNGWSSDMKFALNFMNYLGRANEIDYKVLPEPKNATDLVDTISRFNGIIAGRLHANIISYSLDIPSVGIVWNNKLKFWGENIGYPERFFEVKDFCGSTIVDELYNAIKNGYNTSNKEEFLISVYNQLEKMIRQNLN